LRCGLKKVGLKYGDTPAISAVIDTPRRRVYRECGARRTWGRDFILLPTGVAMTAYRQRWPLVVVAALTAATLTLGATRGSSTMDDQKTQPKTVTITGKDKDAKVRLTRGDLLVVRLEGPLGDGYLWQISRNNKDQLTPQKPPLDKLGKSPPSKVELHVFYLKAEAVGTSDLEFEYRRAADKDAKPARTYKVSVQIE
jgi:predicted secreted protein